MNNFIFPYKTPFQSLPQDLLALIFEFFPLLDFSNLALVCKDFYLVLKKKPELWAKNLFRDFLQINPKDPHFSDEYLFPHVLPVGKEKIKYGEMTHSREFLIEHYFIRKKWKSFFRMFLNLADCNNLLNDVFSALKKPGCPPPCLKKDIHHFPTNSIFQNFLTEVHFGIQGRSFFQDKKQTLIDELAEEVERYHWSTRGDKDHLIEFRWYITEKDPQKSVISNKARMLSLRSKVISKTRPLVRKKELVTAYGKGIKTRLSAFVKRLRTKNKKMMRMITITGRLRKSQRFYKKSHRRRENQEEFPKDRNVVKGSVVEFYNLLQALTENYCKMAFMYLRLVRDPYFLLSEYTRLWNRFVLLVVDLNQTFTSLSGLVNKFYNETFLELPNFPEFSTWRLMVRVWNNNIFSNLQYYLGECFRSIFMEVRAQEKSLSLMSKDMYKCPSCVPNETKQQGLFQKFLYRFKKANEKPVLKDDVIKLLKVFYQAVSDVSYNEYTIFYWDCASIRKSSPKGMLDDFIVQDTKTLYENYKDCLLYDLDHLKTLMLIDRRLVDSILGKAFHPHFSQLQTKVIQEILGQKVCKALDETERNYAVENKSLEDLSNRSNGNGIFEINFKDAFRVLQIKEDIQKRITKNDEKKRKIVQALLRDFKLFNTYLYYIKEEQENIELHTRGIDEIKDHRFLRGFSIVEEKFDKLFDLVKEATLQEIRRIGLDGRDLKEKLESLDDRLVFL